MQRNDPEYDLDFDQKEYEEEFDDQEDYYNRNWSLSCER
jgi:hypothetical protein